VRTKTAIQGQIQGSSFEENSSIMVTKAFKNPDHPHGHRPCKALLPGSRETILHCNMRQCYPELESLTHSLTHSLMELSPSWEAANCAATRGLPSILWNPEVHHCVHISLPPVPILSQIDPIPTIPSYLSKIHFNIVPSHWPKMQLLQRVSHAAEFAIFTESRKSAWLVLVNKHLHLPCTPHRNVRHSGNPKLYPRRHDTAQSSHRTLWGEKSDSLTLIHYFHTQNLMPWIIRNLFSNFQRIDP
jgi:hypothetical protein